MNASMLPSIVLSVFLLLPGAARAGDLHQQLAQARYNFDLDAAATLLPQFAEASSSGEERAVLDFAGVSLLVAELKRGRYESGELEREARRSLGREIDRIARAALQALAQQPESSERFRLEGDLLGTMIRSKFQGMKYQAQLEEALNKAIALDDGNADAWVSLSRRPLFAKPNQGGDLELALNHLNRALALKPDHVQALLFRGTAHAKLGNTDAAEADWARAVELNPNTAGARDRLMAIDMSYDKEPTAGQ